MSSQSGISVSEDLASKFPEFVKSDDVAAVLIIDHDKEHVDLQSRISGEIDDIRDHLNEGKEARYIALRLPDTFAFVLFMPDQAPLSLKMKYASSHATIFRELGGSSLFSTTIFWTTLEEVSLEGLESHKAHEDAPAPLTEEEISLASVKENEIQGTRGTSVAGQSTLSIDANVSEKAAKSLDELKDGKALVFSVLSDGNETIELVKETGLADVASTLKDHDEPVYIVADISGKCIFAFVCPRTASIKQRMLYASTRISFLSYLKQKRTVDATVETFEPEKDLTESKLKEELNFDKSEELSAGISKLKFKKPKPLRRSRN